MKNLVGFAALLAILSSCGENKTPDGYTITETGLQVKQLKTSTSGDTITPHVGDKAYMHAVFVNDKDSAVFKRTDGIPSTLSFDVAPPRFKGDIGEAVMKMHRGDSLTARIPIDSVKKYYKGEKLMNFVLDRLGTTNKYVGLSMRLDSIVTAKMLTERLVAFQKARMVENELFKKAKPVMDSVRKVAATKEASLKKNDKALLAKYLKDHNITDTASASGVYYIESKKGTGKRIAPVTYLRVHFIGKYLDGTVFDGTQIASWMPPTYFAIGRVPMLPGFEEGIEQMNVGGKATFIVPSSMGAKDGLTRVYEVEVVREMTRDERESYESGLQQSH